MTSGEDGEVLVDYQTLTSHVIESINAINELIEAHNELKAAIEKLQGRVKDLEAEE